MQEDTITKTLDEIMYFPILRRSARQSRAPERFDDLLVTQLFMDWADYPLKFTEALSNENYKEWRKAMDHEMWMIKNMKTRELSFLPP